MPDWKRVRINFPTVKLRQFIEPVKETIAEKGSEDFKTVYGVTNVEGITITGKKASKDISNYIVIDKNYFAYNPYRINVGSIGFNSKGLKGCVSPAYVVFRAKNNLSPGFLYVYLKSEFGNHLINWYGNRGGVRNALRYDDLCEIDIPAIDYKTQIELLNKIDRRKISLNSFSEEITQQLGHLKQLRQRILQEAIEGKLTTKWRDKHPDLISGDNHASKLLEKIKAEKERLIKEGKIKKDKPLPPIADDEKPFDLPDGWVWCRLGEIVQSMTNGLYKPEVFYKETGVACLRMYNIQEGKISFHNLKRMILTEEEIKTYSLLEGDLLLNRVNSVELLGKAAYINKHDEPLVYESKNIRVRIVNKEIIPKYVNVVFLTEIIKNQILKNYKKVTGQASINQGQLSCFQIPFLSFAEQQAVVERVDKFMATIDELEKQVSERKEQSEMLMQSILREAFAKR